MFSNLTPALAVVSLTALGSATALVDTSTVDPTPSSIPVARTAPATVAYGMPAPKNAMVLPEASPTLEDLIHSFEDAVESVVLKTSQVCAQTANERLTIERPLTVPTSEVYSFFESVLLQYGYVLSFLKGGDVPTFAVQSLNSNNGTAFRWHEVEDYEALAEHPALLVSTVLELENQDPREISSNMRSLINDSRTSSIVPGGQAIHIRGNGAFVALMVNALNSMDASATPSIPQQPTQQNK